VILILAVRRACLCPGYRRRSHWSFSPRHRVAKPFGYLLLWIVVIGFLGLAM
jgi:hypothetical protein